MTDTKISDLPDGGQLAALDELAIVRGGASFKASVPAVPFDVAVNFGAAAPLIVDTTKRPIINWPDQIQVGDFAGLVDPVAGTIELPVADLYSVRGYIVGDVSLVPADAQMWLYLRATSAGAFNGDYPLAVEHSAGHEATTGRGFAFVLTRNIPAGAILSLVLDANVPMGVYSMLDGSFEAVHT